MVIQTSLAAKQAIRRMAAADGLPMSVFVHRLALAELKRRQIEEKPMTEQVQIRRETGPGACGGSVDRYSVYRVRTDGRYFLGEVCLGRARTLAQAHEIAESARGADRGQ